MNIKSWLKKTKRDPRRKKVADEAETTVKYLQQISYGERKGSYDLCQRLNAASKKHTPDLVMTLEKLRPDIWGQGAVE